MGFYSLPTGKLCKIKEKKKLKHFPAEYTGRF